MTYEEQAKAYDQASPDIKPKLKKILLHSILVRNFGGEEGLKMEKERQVIDKKGLIYLEVFYEIQDNLWQGYLGTMILATRTSGMTPDKQAVLLKPLNEEADAIEASCGSVRQLLLAAAVSPEALKLAEHAETRVDELKKQYNLGQSGPRVPTKDQLADLDKEADQLLDQIKKLPVLTPEEVQKEYDDFPDEDVRQ
jgi:hypothetical protein